MTGSQHRSGDPKRDETRGETPKAAVEKVRDQNNQYEAEAARDRFE
ncbi:hypothetical protein [Paraburkholderia sp. GAS32]